MSFVVTQPDSLAAAPGEVFVVAAEATATG